MHNIIIIQVSFPSDFDSTLLSQELINSKLAICIHVYPSIQSHYLWKGTFESSNEYLLHIKSFKENFKSIEALILDAHPYDVPECVSIAIDNISDGYLDWIESSKRRPKNIRFQPRDCCKTPRSRH